MLINKFKIRFSLISSGKDSEEKQIFLVCTIQGNEVFYYSGFRIYPKNFIKEKTEIGGDTIYIQQAKKGTYNKSGEPAQRINNRIKSLEIAAQTVYERSYQNKEIESFSKNEFKKLLQIELNEYDGDLEEKNYTIIEAYEKYYAETNVSYNRKKHFKSDKERLKRYINGKNIDFSSFNVVDYRKYITSNFVLSENTVVTIMKRLKTFFNYCRHELRIIDKTPFETINFSDKIGTELYSEPICMTRDELSQLYDFKTENKHHALIRDMFCLQAALGCRVSDFIRLTYDNIEDGKLTYFPQKTIGQMQKVVVPISNRANEIIKKYKGHNRGNLIMPFINSVEYNKTLKEVFKLAKLDRKIVEYNRSEKKEKVYKLHELATSHLARRTFVDILCQAGEPIHVVASMSGHSEHSKAFDRYRRRPEQLQIQAVKRSMD